MRQEGWRTVRVFISSTFRDMQEERDAMSPSSWPDRGRPVKLKPFTIHADWRPIAVAWRGNDVEVDS